MTNRFSLSLIFIAFSSLILAQTPKLTFHEMEREQTDPRLVTYAKTESGYVLLKKEPIKGPGGFRYFLDVRDESMGKVRVYNVSAQLGDENISQGRFELLGDKLVLFSKNHIKKNNKVDYYYQSININSFEVSKPQKFYEVPYKDKKKKASLSVTISQNGKYLLVRIDPPYDEGDEESLTMHLMDSELNTIWKREEYGLEHEDKDYSILNVQVSNSGNVYMMGSADDEDDYELYRFSKERVINTDFGFEDFDYRGLSMRLSPKGDVFLSGYITDDDTRGKTGAFMRKLDGKTLNEVSDEQTKYSPDYVFLGIPLKQRLKDEKKAEKKDYKIGVSNLTRDAVLFDDAGSMYLVGSEYYVIVTTTTNSNGGTSTSRTYYYQDIHVSKFDDAGEHVYDAKIPRFQTSKKPLDSFTWLVHNGVISFAFLDHRDNLGIQGAMREDGITHTGKAKKSILAIATIEDENVVTRSILYDYVAKKEKFKIFKMFEGDDEAIISTYFGSKLFKVGFLRAD